MAHRFLRLVDANDTFTFQTFHDRQKSTEEDGTLARVIPGPAGQELLSLHDRGAGVYFTVNRTDGAERKGRNITNIRAVWQEDDDGVAVDFPIEPSLVVESSPGRFHRYWLLAEPWPADERGRADHAEVMERMIETYGSDPNAKDLCRVLRVPGFLNRKHGDPHQVRVVSSPGWRYSRAEILAAFPPVERSQPTKAKTNGATPHSDPGRDAGEDRRIRDALFRIPADERHVWLTVGMAIEAHYGEAGRPLWDEWSLTAKDKYDERDQDKTWRSFKGSGVTIATLFHHAKHGGWEDGTKKLYEEWCKKHAEKVADVKPGSGRLTFFNECLEAKPKDWIIKGVIARGESSSWYAPPKSLKSGLLTDIAIHTAAGSATWRGYRVKARVGVLYIALERGDLTKRRLNAYALRDGYADLPIAVYSGMIDLVDPACIGQILNLAREFEAHYGIPTGLIIIDTVAKGIAATDGDEDKARYQNRVAANMKRVHDELPGVHIAGIGHTGKDESRGERGSNARLADVDVAVQISGDDVKTATVIAANDQASGPLTAFATERVAMGLDEDGDEFEIHILAATVFEAGEESKKKTGWSRALRTLRDALDEAIIQTGRDHRPGGDGPLVKAADVEVVRGVHKKRFVSGGDGDRAAAERMAWKRHLNEALNARLIAGEEHGGRELIWLVREDRTK
jgi:hypothetical protein